MSENLFLPGSNHGGNAAEIEEYLSFPPMTMHDLSMSMNPFAPSCIEVISRLLPAISCYPDERKLHSLLAELLEVDPKYLLLTNGAAEAIALVAGVIKVARLIKPEFSLWEKHLLVISEEAGLVKSNPGNPTGKLAPESLKAMVFDEAFYQMSTGEWSRRDFETEDTIVIGSLTKLLATPGLRLGYVICCDEAKLASIKKRKPGWSVGSLTLAVAETLLPQVDLSLTKKLIQQRQNDLKHIFESYDLKVKANDAPWVLIEDAPWLRYFLALEKILLRDCTSFGLPNTLRVGLPNDMQLEYLPSALEKAIYNADKAYRL